MPVLSLLSSAPNIDSFVLPVFYSTLIPELACKVATPPDLGSALNVRFEYITFCLNLTTDGLSNYSSSELDSTSLSSSESVHYGC